jgi:hypothetical protein
MQRIGVHYAREIYNQFVLAPVTKQAGPGRGEQQQPPV